MPQGSKMELTVTTNTGGNNYKLVTFMTREEIDLEIFGPFPAGIPSESAMFRGVNEFDEDLIVKIKRLEVQGYMLSPFHQRVQTVPAQMVPPRLGGRQ